LLDNFVEYEYLNKEDENGNTALHLAAMWGHFATTQLLINKKGCKMEAINQDGNTPLHLSVLQYDCYAVAKLLLSTLIKNKSDYYTKTNNNGQTPLDLASDSNKREMVNLFKSFDILKKYSVPEVIKLQDTTELKKLIDEGENVDKQQINDGCTGLHIAAQKGNLDLVQSLLLAKANTTIQDKWKRTPLHYASQNSKKEIAQVLLKEGCDPHVLDKNGMTVLIYAIQHGAYDIVDVLIKSNCNVQQKDGHGCTPLHKAAFFGQKRIVELLLAAGCKNIQDRKGITPLDLATEWDSKEIIKLLKDKGDK